MILSSDLRLKLPFKFSLALLLLFISLRLSLSRDIDAHYAHLCRLPPSNEFQNSTFKRELNAEATV